MFDQFVDTKTSTRYLRQLLNLADREDQARRERLFWRFQDAGYPLDPTKLRITWPIEP